jgi:phenylacetic acid degradation operon negative regulatory protein
VVAQAWDLKHLAQGYVAFCKQYQPVLLHLQKQQIADQQAFLLRILLVHDFRRLLLRDPMLPLALLPVQWPGSTARLLFNKLYAALQKASEQYLDEHFQTADQTTPARSTVVSKRIAAMRGRSKF